MTFCETSTRTDERMAGHWRDLVAGFARRISAIYRIAAARREVRKLDEFDDRQLRDIGLRREDIRASLSCGYLDDPSGFLWERTREHSRQVGRSRI